MSMPALRIVPPPPALLPPPGQVCFAFIPVTIVVRGPAKRARKCKAAVSRVALTWLRRLGQAITWGRPRPIEVFARPVAARPIRSKKLQLAVPRRQRDGVKPQSLGTARLSERARSAMHDDIAALEADGSYAERPRHGNGISGDCPTGPCPYAGCRHHIKLETKGRAVKDMFPALDVDEMIETCSFRFAAQVEARGEEASQNEVGKILNLTAARIQQIELVAMAKVRLALAKLMGGLNDSDNGVGWGTK